MTDEQINAAIAEACGWKAVCIDGGSGFYKGFDNGAELRPDLPSYCTDLNAMHEAESLYIEMDEWWETYLGHIGAQWSRQHVAHAPARQRAEAFLKTLGKWEGSNE